MTQAQDEALNRLFPLHVDKTRSLGAWGDQQKDVIDPWGGSHEVYRQTAYEIGQLLSQLKGHLRERSDH
ncbi:MAG TPA: hypothetical protein VFC84_10530 [Desulfosporosinus sp.]|nr:hypothetical protein [Desulfosporosinus sp.]